jgi:hypothetical protein
VCSRGNPFIIQAPQIKLHNFVIKQLADNEVSARLLQALVNGGRCYKEFCNERFVQKKNKLSVTISKRNLPRLEDKAPTDTPVSTDSVSKNMKILATAQHDMIDNLKERGMSLE